MSVAKATPVATDNNQTIVQEAMRQSRATYSALKKQELISISIAPMYQAYFGKNMPVSINGILIYVPVNGQVHKIPKGFADIVAERVAAINAYVAKQGRLSNVEENREAYIGEIGF